MDIITTSGLTKAYGSTRVVDDLDLRVPEGCVYGFLGPNGSGKSTTMKMLLSLVQPTAGEALVLGDPMTRATRRRLLAGIGSLIEAPSVYGHLTGRENLRIAQLQQRLSDDDVAAALRTVRLEQHADKLVKKYSLGMKQRLGIALALVGRPRLLILDEPTNGLDPAGIDEVRELIVGLARDGVTVMVSSHQLAEVERMAQVIGVVDHGRLVFQGTRDELFARATPALLIDTPQAERALGVLGTMPAERRGDTVHLGGLDADATADVVAHLVHHDVPIHGVRRQLQSLEDMFLELTAPGGAL